MKERSATDWEAPSFLLASLRKSETPRKHTYSELISPWEIGGGKYAKQKYVKYTRAISFLLFW